MPEKVVVAGKPSEPAFVTMQVFVFSGTTATVPERPRRISPGSP